MHSNGYTLARNIIKNSKLNYNEKFPYGLYPGKTIGDILLEPTKIYVKEVLDLLKKFEIHGIAHITGGGLRNFLRLNNKVKYEINAIFEPPPIFSFIQKNGKINDKEMYQTFNMGMGLAIIVSKIDSDQLIRYLKKNSSSDVKEVGRIEGGGGVEVTKLGIKF